MRIAVIGAGFAGLAAAVDLQERRHAVTLFERRGVPGGRATSYRDAPSGDEIGSGRHLLFGADVETLDLLRRSGAADELEACRLAWRWAGGDAPLELARLPGRLALMGGLLASRLPWRLRLDAMRLALRPGLPAAGVQAEAFLAGRGQGSTTRARLWDPLSRLLVHEGLGAADAGVLFRALGRTLLAGRRRGAVLRPRTGLGPVHRRIAAYLEARGGRLVRRARVTGLLHRDGRVVGVSWVKRPEARQAIRHAEDPTEAQAGFDAVVSAVPWRALVALLPEPLRDEPPWSLLGRTAGTPAATAEVWLDSRLEGEPIRALGDEDFVWAFAHGGRRLSLTLSDALQQRVTRGGRELNAAVATALERSLGRGAQPARVQLIREVEGTLPQSAPIQRPVAGRSPLPGLFVAGDWTGDAPVSVESAVRSGRAAARRLEAAGLTARRPGGTGPASDPCSR